MLRFQQLEEIKLKRQATLERLAELGVNEDFISSLVDEFYLRIRADRLLGPVFEAEIGDSWGPHLEKMKRFWSTIVLKTNTFSGKPIPAHQKLKGISPAHFSHWLNLFEETLSDLSSSDEVVTVFMTQAKQIAKRLESVMELGSGDSDGSPS